MGSSFGAASVVAGVTEAGSSVLVSAGFGSSALVSVGADAEAVSAVMESVGGLSRV